MATQYQVPGPTKVSYGGANLGYTKTGVTIRVTTNWKPITADEFGDQPADYILAGKSAIVTAIFVDMALVAAAKPMIGKYLWLLNASGTSQIGKIAFDGEQDTATDLGQALVITEDTGGVWTANQCIPTGPEQMALTSTEENQVQLEFRIIPDEDDQLFAGYPSYLS